MKLLVLTVLLSIVQATPPIPRHTADKAGSPSKHIKKPSEDKQPPAELTPTVQPISKAEPDQGGANNPSTPNAKQSIAVTELPAVSVTKDWLDITAWGFSIALLFIGALGVLAAVKTLKAMKAQATEMALQRVAMQGQLTTMQGQFGEMQKQAAEMEKQTRHLEVSVAAAKTSADAAKLSGDIAARVSIPTLVIDKFETGDTGSANIEAMLQYPKVKVVIKNYGQTPAFLRSWTIIFFCGDLPPLPEYKGHRASGIVLERDVVQPNVLYTLPEIYSWHRQEISLTDVRAIISREKHLWAYGFISYYDLFGTRRRFKFCEYALNVSEGWIQWVGGFSPEAYTGTDDFPFGQAAGTEEKAENPN